MIEMGKRKRVCSECGIKESYGFFSCSICKKEYCHREIAREHPPTCMKCFWKEVNYVPPTKEELAIFGKEGEWEKWVSRKKKICTERTSKEK